MKMKIDLSLYLVTDSTGMEEEKFLHVVDEACQGGVTFLQVREKSKTGREYLELAAKVKKITDRYGIPLIIDDRVDVALAVDAAGVHVGQSDIPVEAARRLVGEDKIVGATAKTVEQALAAEQAGADYLGVGAIYPTTTKVITKITEVSTLNDIRRHVSIPVTAIGGLNAGNMDILNGSLADGVAVVSAIMKSENPYETAVRLRETFRAVKSAPQNC